MNDRPSVLVLTPTLAGHLAVADDAQKLAHLLHRIFQDLDDRGYPGAPAVLRGAQALATAGHATADDGCRGCGCRLDHPATGRRRVWCSETCRRRHRP